MKTLNLTLYLIFASFILKAATYTCSNSPLGGAQFDNLQNAYNACNSSGDTILLENTNINYLFTTSWNKNIVLIGGGLSSEKRSIIQTIFFSFSIDPNANGSEFQGILFLNYLQIVNGVEDITFSNCLINNIEGVRFDANATNIGFINCIFAGGAGRKILLSSTSTQSVSAFFSNCIFDGFIDGAGGISHSLLFDHCLFLLNSGATLRGLRDASLRNSIFMNTDILADANTTGCTFLNNVYDPSQTVPPVGNSGSGNIAGTPNFTNFTGPLYSETHDYDLIPGSVGVGAAIGGSDIGVHGGTSGFTEALEPSIAPVVRSVIIQNTTVGSGGTLNVDIEATPPLTD
jgi:hypothetical protein